MDKIDDNGGFLETRDAPLYDELLGVDVPVLREPIPLRLAVFRQHPVVDVPVNLALELPLRRESLLVFPVEIVAEPKQGDGDDKHIKRFLTRAGRFTKIARFSK